MQKMPPEYTEQFEIDNVSVERPHVVLLGAGASYAAFQNGDRNGNKLPLLRDFVDVIGLEQEMKVADVSPPYVDFEAIYTSIHANPNLASVKASIEKKVIDYFSQLELPDEPTLYDHLVLSLRRKDVIATFNWDPFLWDAMRRNHEFAQCPRALFLHGSVSTSLCTRCKVIYPKNAGNCKKCDGSLEKSPLLFPVQNKDYTSDPAIAAHWKDLRSAMQSACAVTIFGYSAPKTDKEAIQILKDGWGNWKQRSMEQIEIIDILDEDKLINTWDEFIHTHHVEVVDDFYKSFLANHPRRSCEAYYSQYVECMFLDDFTMPQNTSFDILYDWLKPRVKKE